MSFGDGEIQQIGEELAAPIPPWLPGLMASIRQGGLRPKDPRVRSLWTVLRQRGLLARSPWLQQRLRYIWNNGLSVRLRPRTAARMTILLRRWGFLLSLPAGAVLPQNINVNVTSPVWAGGRRRYPIRPVMLPSVRPLVRPMTRYAYGARR